MITSAIKHAKSEAPSYIVTKTVNEQNRTIERYIFVTMEDNSPLYEW